MTNMPTKRLRARHNMPPDARRASADLEQVVRAAHRLAEVDPPRGGGLGQGLIEREIREIRERIHQLTKGASSLEEQVRSPYRLLVVGPSQAGKSTLINVIAGERILPTAGGGDAKTLKETVLTFSDEGQRVARIRYIGRREAQQRRFTLEARCRRDPALARHFIEPWDDKGAAEGADVDVPLDDDGDEDGDQAATARGELDRKHETLVAQIATLVYPELRDPAGLESLSDADRESQLEALWPDWVDAWCLLLGQKTVAGERFGALWRPRLAAYEGLVGTTREVREAEVGPRAFRELVEAHTAGPLAFLVDRVELGLPSDSLAHMDVEDLPGVGNFQDPASHIARDVLAQAMRERELDGLLIVTSQNGLDQTTATLIEETGVLRRVLQGDTDLAVAVTHVDNIARQREQDLEDQGLDDDDFPDTDDILREAGADAAARQHQKLTELLRRHSSTADEAERSRRVEAVLARACVLGVEASAAEAYRFGLRATNRAYAKSLEATGVPALLAHFEGRAAARHAERLERVRAHARRVREAVTADLRRLAQDHDVAAETRLASAAREAYLAALEGSRGPLANRWTTHRERLAAQLAHEPAGRLPEIQLRAQAEATARKAEIIDRCEHGGTRGRLIHWATLKAALRRGGTWAGAMRLDLPGDLGGALMPELLSGWRALTASVKELLGAYREAAERLLEDLGRAAADAASAAGLEPDVGALDDARAQLRRDVEAALALLDAYVEQLEERVPQRLRQELLDHFEVQCQRVLADNPHGGPPGFTRRLLRGYDRVGQEAIARGAKVGVDVLREALIALREQFSDGLFAQDPVASAYRRLASGLQPLSDAPELVAARAALVAWAREHQRWDAAGREAA